jgi:hypothetical protein
VHRQRTLGRYGARAIAHRVGDELTADIKKAREMREATTSNRSSRVQGTELRLSVQRHAACYASTSLDQIRTAFHRAMTVAHERNVEC